MQISTENTTWASRPAWNESKIEQLSAHLEEDFVEFLELFAGESEAHTQRIATLVARNQVTTELQRAAHSLKSSGAMLGTHQLAAIACEIEAEVEVLLCAEKADLEVLRFQANALSDAYKVVKPCIANAIEGARLVAQLKGFGF